MLPQYFDASDWGMIDVPIYGSYSSGDGENYGQIGTDRTWGFTNPAYSHFNMDQRRQGGSGDFQSSDANYMMEQGADGQSFGIRYKSGEKEGTTAQYRLNPATGRFEMVGGPSQLEWDTNPSTDNWGIASVLGAALGGAALSGAFGGGAGAAGAASGSGAAAGGSGWAGMGLADAAMMGGAGAPVGWVTPGVAAAGAGASGAAGGGGSSIWDAAGSYVANPSNWGTLAQGVGLLGGALAGGANGGNGGGGSAGFSPITPTVRPEIGGPGRTPYQSQMPPLPTGNTQTEDMMRQYLPGLFGRGHEAAAAVSPMVAGANRPYGSKSGLLSPPPRSPYTFGE